MLQFSRSTVISISSVSWNPFILKLSNPAWTPGSKPLKNWYCLHRTLLGFFACLFLYKIMLVIFVFPEIYISSATRVCKIIQILSTAVLYYILIILASVIFLIFVEVQSTCVYNEWTNVKKYLRQIQELVSWWLPLEGKKLNRPLLNSERCIFVDKKSLWNSDCHDNLPLFA